MFIDYLHELLKGNWVVTRNSMETITCSFTDACKTSGNPHQKLTVLKNRALSGMKIHVERL